MPTKLPPHLNDRCACGHLRGEHLTPQGGETEYCLIQDCTCAKFELVSGEGTKARAATTT